MKQKELVSVSGEGKIKRTSIEEFSVQGRATKGGKIQKVTDGDWMADFLPIQDEKELTIIATSSQIKLSTSSIIHQKILAALKKESNIITLISKEKH